MSRCKNHNSLRQLHDARGRFSRSPVTSFSGPSSRRRGTKSTTGFGAIAASSASKKGHKVGASAATPKNLGDAAGGASAAAAAPSSRINNNQVRRTRHICTCDPVTPENDVQYDFPDVPASASLALVDGKKYEVVYHKITCHLAINAESDDEVTNDPVLSGGQIRRMAEQLRRAIKRKMQVGEYLTAEVDD